MKNAVAGLAAATAFSLAMASAPAFAAGEVAQVELCAAALDAEGLAAAADYRAKFVKSKGGATKTVTVELIPHSADNDVITAECRIKGGEVRDVAVKA